MVYSRSSNNVNVTNENCIIFHTSAILEFRFYKKDTSSSTISCTIDWLYVSDFQKNVQILFEFFGVKCFSRTYCKIFFWKVDLALGLILADQRKQK